MPIVRLHGAVDREVERFQSRLDEEHRLAWRTAFFQGAPWTTLPPAVASMLPAQRIYSLGQCRSTSCIHQW